MTIISNSSPLATYLASATKPSTTGTSGSTSGTTTGTDGKATDKPADPSPSCASSPPTWWPRGAAA